VRLSQLNDHFDSRPRTVEVSWAELIDALKEPRITQCQPCASLQRDENGQRNPNKCDARKGPAWSPAVTDETEDPDGKGWRKNSHVIGMGCLVFDIDHVTRAELEAICLKIDATGYAAILHSTHSHNPDLEDDCARIVLPVTRELTPAEIKPTRDAVQNALGFRADENTKDLVRLYYFPSRPDGGPAYMFAHVEGKAVEPVGPMASAPAGAGSFLSSLGVAATRGEAMPPPASKVGVLSTEPVDMDRARSRLSAYARGHDEKHALVRRVLNQEKLADSGGRDNAVQSAAGAIAYTIPDVPIGAMLEIMTPSLAQMDPPEAGDWISIARDKLERAWERWDRERQRKQEQTEIAKAFMRRVSAESDPDEAGNGGSDGTGPFDEARVRAWAEKHHTTLEGFRKRWIIRHHGGNWVFCNGYYRSALRDEDLLISLMRDLARAPVTLMTEDANGNSKPRPLMSICLDYGEVARCVSASLALQESYYEPETETFHEAVAPIRRTLRPIYDAEIHEWLALGGGDKLLDWIAAVSDLEKSASALYWHGPKGIGKNVLADGLARLWHTGGPTEFRNVVGTAFNDALTRCPLIFADEGLPKTDTIVDEIRKLIGSSDRNLNRKFMPIVPLTGNVRLMIAANNANAVIATGAELEREDIAALAERLLIIGATDEAAKYLESFRQSRGHNYIKEWVRDDRIAQHALWLGENRTVDETKRFIASDVPPATLDRLLAGTVITEAVLEFLCRFLSDPAAAKMPNSKLRVGNGELLVNTELLADKHAWEMRVPSRKVQPAKKISTALKQISLGTVTIADYDFHKIDVEFLLRWARETQVGSHSIMKARIYATVAK
jgi:hypothetical protein